MEVHLVPNAQCSKDLGASAPGSESVYIMLLLSSFDRAFRFACVEDTPKNRRFITQYIYSVSQQIQDYLDTEFALEQRIEFFNIEGTEREFWLGAIPITILTEVSSSFDGLFDASSFVLSDPYIGKDGNSVVIQFTEVRGKKTIRVTYTGGVATTATISTFAINSIIGSFLVGKFARGIDSGAVGIIKKFSSTSIDIDNLYGVFGLEKITMQTTEGGDDVPGIEATITSITNQSFAEQLPEVTQAVDIQIAYNLRVKDTIELKSINKDKTVRRDDKLPMEVQGQYANLQPEVTSLIQKHRRYRMNG